LLSLAVAYGDTGKLLSAASAMLMSHRSNEKIIMPAILVISFRTLQPISLNLRNYNNDNNNILQYRLIQFFINTFILYFRQVFNDQLQA